MQVGDMGDPGPVKGGGQSALCTVMRCSSTVTLLQITQTAAATTNKPNAANKTFLPNPVIPSFLFVYASLRIAGFYEDFYHEYSFLDRKILQFELKKKTSGSKPLVFSIKGLLGAPPVGLFSPYCLFPAMNASMSLTVLRMLEERSIGFSSVMTMSFSMRMPMPSSSMYRPGSTVMTMPGRSVLQDGVVTSWQSSPRLWLTL